MISYGSRTSRVTRGLNRFDRRGMTLVEIMIVMIIFGIVVTGALGFMAAQSKAFYRGADKLTALQNLRFSLDRLETDVQTAGTNLVDGQPWLVYVDDDVLAFNADYATNVANDYGAVFYDPGAPNGTVRGLTAPITVPNSTFMWGDTVYTVPGVGVNGQGETLIFFMADDTSTARSDDYALYRKVNTTAPELIARSLLRSGTEPFFRYFWNQDEAGSPLIFDSVADSALPWAHIAKEEDSPADSGTSAQMDLIKAVRVTLKATNGQVGPDERTAELSRVIIMRNADVERIKTCGDTPLLGAVGLNVAATDPDGDGTFQVDLNWAPATDETMGELDVIAYTVWRRAAADLTWGDPYLSIPAGNPSYNYSDQSVTAGETYTYAVAAKDCTPSVSSQEVSAPVVVP